MDRFSLSSMRQKEFKIKGEIPALNNLLVMVRDIQALEEQPHMVNHLAEARFKLKHCAIHFVRSLFARKKRNNPENGILWSGGSGLKVFAENWCLNLRDGPLF